MDVALHKKACRQQLRAVVHGLVQVDRQCSVDAVLVRLLELPEFRAASRVGLFAALPDELSVSSLADRAIQLGKLVAYPRVTQVDERRMEFAGVSGRGDLQPGAYQIPEPPAHFPALEPAELDCVLVPGVGFTRSGERLGRGAGYYDRWLANFPGVRIGVAFSCQLIDAIPHSPWDASVHIVVTEREVIRCREP